MTKTKKRGESPLFLLMEISQNKTFWYNNYMYTKNEDECTWGRPRAFVRKK